VVENALGVLQNVQIPKPHYHVAKALQVCGSSHVPSRCLIVLRSIYLQDEHRFITQKVGDEPAARHLATELEII
jgi:hypothetical protein